MRFSVSKIFCLMVFFVASFHAIGQKDTLLQIDTVFISAATLPYSNANSTGITVDQSNGNQNITELLSRQSGIFIKNYGSFSLASSSIRGGAANHTAINWNGTSIINPMVGQLDLNLLPMGGFNQITLFKGGEGVLAGSGAIGGNIELANAPSQIDRLGLILGSGSFGRQKIGLDLNKKFNKLSISANVGFDQSRNDFTYKPAPQIEKTNTNGQGKIFNQLYQLMYNHSANLSFYGRVWHTDALRHIPPTTVQNESIATQKDQSLRTQLSMLWLKGNFSYQPQFTWISDKNIYNDEALRIDNNNRYESLNLEHRFNWYAAKNSKLFVNIIYNALKANSENYVKEELEKRLSLVSAFTQKFGLFSGQIALRKELIENQKTPIVPSLVISNAGKAHQISLRIQKNYRLPTMNERYWRPGGRLDVLPESGWSQDLTMTSKKYKYLETSVSIYNRVIDNWIQWVPVDGQFIYSPTNIAKVWSRGVDFQLKGNGKIRPNQSITYALNAAFVKSTNQVEIPIPLTAKGSQLLYTPTFTAGAMVEYQFGKFQFGLFPNYVSSSKGINEDIKAYGLLDASLSYHTKVSRMAFDISFQCRNFLDKGYYVVERRAMPGRNFGVDLVIGWE